MADQLWYKIIDVPTREFCGRIELHLSRKREEVAVDEPDCLSRSIEYGVNRTRASANRLAQQWRNEMTIIFRANEVD
jgi:hypothetical protein